MESGTTFRIRFGTPARKHWSVKSGELRHPNRIQVLETQQMLHGFQNRGIIIGNSVRGALHVLDSPGLSTCSNLEHILDNSSFSPDFSFRAACPCKVALLFHIHIFFSLDVVSSGLTIRYAFSSPGSTLCLSESQTKSYFFMQSFPGP